MPEENRAFESFTLLNCGFRSFEDHRRNKIGLRITKQGYTTIFLCSVVLLELVNIGQKRGMREIVGVTYGVE